MYHYFMCTCLTYQLYNESYYLHPNIGLTLCLPRSDFKATREKYFELIEGVNEKNHTFKREYKSEEISLQRCRFYTAIN